MDADAIVIGAGAAGLAAARQLASRGFSTRVVEARDRIGGRVWARRASADPVPGELGAEFIHGPAPETLALLRDAGSERIETGGDSWVRGPSGEFVREDDDFLASAALLARAERLERDESVERFLQRFDGEPAMREAVLRARLFVEGFEAADPSIASVQAIAKEWSSGVDSTSGRPRGGYAPMFERLYADCMASGVAFDWEARVRRIGWGAAGVEIETAPPRARSLCARTAIVTLPAGVMRHRGDGEVRFEPPLPAQKRESLAHIEMGAVVKACLWFHTPFWNELRDGRYRDAGFFRAEGAPFGVFWTQYPERSNAIAAWIGGPKAAALLRNPPGDLVTLARDAFGDALGDRDLARRCFAEGAMHDWHADPFARGAYSYVAVGGGAARETLGASLANALFFAGEATSTDGQGGTVNGALQTGERAAAQAAAAMEAR
ncbi:MAG TPA: NAD(P)/FAD-dependent oxidoreductase [Candidatus Cybelea sp.]|jgi:monoamine oxidase|nr:NAD(P)/FAD-dependent oxidoreductase [Candidatus Cybelea sp.]